MVATFMAATALVAGAWLGIKGRSEHEVLKMGLVNWRETTVEVLSEEVGPVAALLVQDALDAMRFAAPEMPASEFLRFLRALNRVLPGDIDRDAVCVSIQDAVFYRNGFTAHPGRPATRS